MSETAGEADGEGDKDWDQVLMDLFSSSRFPRNSGARCKTRDLISYTADRVELAYPDRNKKLRFRRLPPPIRAHLNIQFVVGLVGNGGVEYLLHHGMPSGSWFGEVARDFRLAGATEVADRLSEVYRLFPGGMPQRRDRERMISLAQVFEEHEDVFERASAAVWKADEAASRVATTRVRLAVRLPRSGKRKPDPMNRATHYQPL